MEKNEIELKIPEGFEISYLPMNSNYINDEFGFSIEYEKDAGKVVMKKEVYINTLMLRSSSFEEWNNMIRILNKAYKDVLVLKENIK